MLCEEKTTTKSNNHIIRSACVKTTWYMMWRIWYFKMQPYFLRTNLCYWYWLSFVLFYLIYCQCIYALCPSGHNIPNKNVGLLLYLSCVFVWVWVDGWVCLCAFYIISHSALMCSFSLLFCFVTSYLCACVNCVLESYTTYY